jgi:ABC-type transport system involved in cytochrome c biogenesis permease subunit
MLDGITLFCFGASYALALVLELLQLRRPGRGLRYLSLSAGGAGLFAHTIYLLNHFARNESTPLLASQMGSLLFLAWILAIFYLYGALHHRKVAWGIFVLPLVIGLVALAWLVTEPGTSATAGFAFRGEPLWRIVHGTLLLFAAVGVCVGFVASSMYLVQAHRLKAKTLGNHGPRLFSLERLETMNRRAINGAFPLLTAGMLVGVALMIHGGNDRRDWTDVKVVAALVLWLVFALLLYLRYGVHLSGRRLAWLTMLAFTLLLVTLSFSHSFVQGDGP